MQSVIPAVLQRWFTDDFLSHAPTQVERVKAILRRAAQAYAGVLAGLAFDRVAGLPYAEIRDNLLDAQMLPIDLLRCKLAFFGASRFDPRSDRWVRISLFHGQPYPDEVSAHGQRDTLGAL